MRHYNPILHGSQNAWADSTKYYSGGGGTSTSYATNVPLGMEDEAANLFNMAQQQLLELDAEGNIVGFKPYVPYSANPADYVAGFSPMQEQSFKGAANLQVPGQFGQATDLAGAAGMGGINSAQQAYDYGAQGAKSGMMGQNIGLTGGQAYGNMGAQYGAQGAGYGDIAAQIGQMGLQAQQTGQGITQQSQDLAAQQAAAGDIYQQLATNPEAVQAYMSPYQQAVTQQAIDSAYRNAAIQKTGRQAAAAKAGAFGGSRQAIENAEAQRALNDQIQGIEALGLQSAYDKAIQSMQYGTNLGVQGLGGAQSGLGTALQGGQLGLSGIGTALQGLQGGMQGSGLGMQGAGIGLQGVNTQLAGTAQGMQGAGVGLQGVSGAQAGYGLANQAGSNLANIGSQQNQVAQSILDQQNRFGAQQQQQQQNITNQAIQNYAMAQENPNIVMQNLSNMIRGTQGQGSSTTNYQAGPNIFGAAANTALAYAGAKQAGVLKEGGIVKLAQGGMVKGYADGGVTGIDNVEKIAGKLSIPQLQQAMQNKTVPEYIGIPLLQMKTQEAQAAQAAQQAQQGGQAPSIKDQIMQQAQQMQGIEGLPSNLPTEEMADGGIVAFAGPQGSYVREHVKGAPEFNFMPEEYKSDIQKALYEQSLNPATGKPYTEEELIAKEEAKRTKAGIKDIYTPESDRLEKEIGGLKNKKKEAFGLALMQGAFKSLAKGDPNFARSIGITGEGTTTALIPALKEINDSEKDMRKQQFNMSAAGQQFKQAQLSGDQAAIDRAQNKYATAATNFESAQNKNIEARNAAGQKGYEAEYGYKTDIDKQRIASASAHNTDLRWLTNVKYKELVAAGAPANEQTLSKASNLAANEMGKIAGSDRLDLDTSKLSADVAGKIETAIAASKEIKGWSDLRNLEMMKKSRANPEDIAKYDTLIADEKARIAKSLLSGNALAPAPGGNKPVDKVQSANKFVLDGFSFPDQKSLDAYKKAKTKANS